MVARNYWIILLSFFVAVSLLLNGCEDEGESLIATDPTGNSSDNPSAGSPSSTPDGSTPAPPGGDDDDDQEFDISGSFTFSLSSDPDAVLADEDAREVIEDAAIQTIAESTQVNEEDVSIDSLTVVTTGGGRRLQEKVLKVAYTITLEEKAKAEATNSAIANLPADDLKTKLDSAITQKIAALDSEKRAALEAKLGNSAFVVASMAPMELLEIKTMSKKKRPCKNCKRCKRKCTTTFLGTRITTTTTTQPKELDAEFLMQATFGPTRSTLNDLAGTTYADWIKQQMALPIESHRAYYRQRVNPRHPETLQIGKPYGNCEVGSRWSGVAFTKLDVKKPISVRANKVSVEGVWRTDIDPTGLGNLVPAPAVQCTDIWEGKTCPEQRLLYRCRFDKHWMANDLFRCRKSCYDQGAGYDGDDCSVGWNTLGNYDGYICDMRGDTVGSWMQLSTSEDCKENRQGMKIPAFWISDPTSASVVAAPMTFKPNPTRSDILTMATTSPACNTDLHSKISLSGRFYFYDPRLQLIENSLERPASAPVGATTLSVDEDYVDETLQAQTIQLASESSGTVDVCATVVKTFLNENHCKLAAACTPLHLQRAMLTLNKENFKKFHTIGSKYIYEIIGLQPEVSPCGELARWVQCTGCTETEDLPDNDIKAIQSALLLHEGNVRDIIVPCNKEAVPATVNGQPLVVKVEALYFQYKHLNEHNVYDFTEWVDAHPGGAARIQQWANSPNDFTLVFPIDSHDMTRWNRPSTQEKLNFLGKIGEVVDFRSLPSNLQTQELANAFSSEGSNGYFQACGSPFEVANSPSKGHNMAMYTMYQDTKTKYVDTTFDNSYWKGAVNTRNAKQQVWFMTVLHAKDQLRQRMAWALSQILVTSAEGAGNDAAMNEMWINYYDIFARNAFGNFRDIMREVTYSPLMAVYLTYLQNKAYDFDNRFPDENYAREIQQLFTIGLWMLNPDGTKVVKDGVAVPTYDNDDIMNFARVFTGFDTQLPRSNIESLNNNRNLIDPMQIKTVWHDVYPKPDLNKNYLGDGYPLCSDIPPGAFLEKGAVYEFIGYSYDGGDAMILSATSKLYKKLCKNNDDPTKCKYKLKVTLPSKAGCAGRECSMDTVRVVKVGVGYFEYVPPTCVHLFFYNGRVTRNGGRKFTWASQTLCANPDTHVAGTSCCKGCTNKPTSSMTRDGITCETLEIARLTRNCNKNEDWTASEICQMECWNQNLGYSGDDCGKDGAYVEERICGHFEDTVRFSVAEDNCAASGKAICDKQTSKASCGYDEMSVWTAETCSLAIEIDASGKVSAQTTDKTKQNKISVQWKSDFPKASNCPAGCTTNGQSCICDVTVTVTPVFNAVPTKAQVENDLKLGALPPRIDCTSSCTTGEVKVYGNMDKDTIFEVGGRFYKNAQSVVSVASGYEFRNPPVFTLAEAKTQRSIHAEVESLLDHLFDHPNTPTFISYRLIQRLTSSNPSGAYVRAVGNAFKTGTYGGVTYSGKYGDLGATVAAILLHPEARMPGSLATSGKLREPMIKLTHFLRAMEYTDKDNREILFLGLEDNTGQAPYKSPTVFNFFFVDYQPPRFSGSTVAPEFQIFTPPYWLSYLNGMVSLIDNTLSSCYSGFGVQAETCNFNPQGSFNLAEQDEAEKTLAELNLLLTGGRSTSMQLIRKAYNSAEAGKGFQAAQKAIVMSQEFNVLGSSLPAGWRPEVAPKESHDPTSYKAAVLLWMGGGADTFNMLVPLNCDMHTQYKDIRTNVALAPNQLLEISSANQVCEKFGIHKSFSFLHGLYNEGEAAFVSNIGPLVEPTDRSNFKTGARRCVGLFSHSDQVNAAQTLQCQIPGTSPKGAGGRLGDALAGSMTVTSFSISGTSTWSEGVRTHTEIIDKSKGAVQFLQYQEMKDVVDNITSKKHNNVYANEFSLQFGEFIASSEKLGALFEQAQLNTEFTTTSRLGEQLRQVAKLISVRSLRKAERDLFYVNIGGFDSHSNVAQILTDNFAEIDNALQTFVTELKQDPDGVFDETVIFSQSDFGRTLTSNGPGTDHGWAGNHFVIGGKLNGGKIFNKFPTSFLAGNDQDAGRGRLIPRFPWESMMVPIAEWMGLGKAKLNEVFPNLGNFNATKHIIPTWPTSPTSSTSLFKS